MVSLSVTTVVLLGNFTLLSDFGSVVDGVYITSIEGFTRVLFVFFRAICWALLGPYCFSGVGINCYNTLLQSLLDGPISIVIVGASEADYREE